MAGFLGLAYLFVARDFDREVIVLCVRWYLRFKLSYRDWRRSWPSAVSRSSTPPSCAECTGMFLSLSGAGTGLPARSGVPGGSTRPT